MFQAISPTDVSGLLEDEPTCLLVPRPWDLPSADQLQHEASGSYGDSPTSKPSTSKQGQSTDQKMFFRLHDLPQELCDEIYKYTFEFRHEISMRKFSLQVDFVDVFDWIKIECVLRHVCRESAQHVYRLLELEVKRYLRNHTPYLKDPSLPDSTSASYICILTDLVVRFEIEEVARPIQDVICIERLSSEPCECRPCNCVGTRDFPDSGAWYKTLCSMPALKTFSVEIAYREKDLKRIHHAAIGIGKRLLQEKRIKALYLLSVKQIEDAVRYFSVESHFGEILNADSHPAHRTDPKKLAEREIIVMRIPYSTYKMREVLWSPDLMAMEGGVPEMREVLKIVRQSDIDMKC